MRNRKNEDQNWKQNKIKLNSKWWNKKINAKDKK
jgi:hypothetical protein